MRKLISIRAGDFERAQSTVPTQTFQRRILYKDKNGKIQQRLHKWEEPIITEEEPVDGNVPKPSQRRSNKIKRSRSNSNN